MNIEQLQRFCLSLPSATEDIKWENDLCFSIGSKMFCVSSLEEPLKASLKVQDQEFDELTNSPGIIPAPYLARYKWISIQNPDRFRRDEWEHYVRQSYQLVRAKLPRKVLNQLDPG